MLHSYVWFWFFKIKIFFKGMKYLIFHRVSRNEEPGQLIGNTHLPLVVCINFCNSILLKLGVSNVHDHAVK